MTKTKVKTIYKIKWKNLFKVILVLLVLVGLIVGCSIAYGKYSDYNRTKKQMEAFKNKTVLTNIVDDETTQIIEQTEEISKFDTYWNYIKLSLLEVDMAAIKKVNSDSIGYLEIKGINSGYPVVQSKSNSYYLNHSYDKSSNDFGWIYLDHRNDSGELSNNNIIYGNNLLLNLDGVFKTSWKSDSNNYIIKYVTSTYTTLWQIVSAYKTESSDYLKINFEDDYTDYIKDIMDRSEIDFKTTVNENDKLMTVTTNSDGSNYVVHAKLIKIKTTA